MNSMYQTTFIVDDLCCREEEQQMEKTLQRLDGIRSFKVNLIARTVRIEHDSSSGLILATLRKAGFHARYQGYTGKTGSFGQLQTLTATTLLSAVLLVLGLFLSASSNPGFPALPLYVASMLISGWRIAVKGLRSVRHHSLDMNILMIVGAGGAAAIGRWAEGAAVLVLFALSQVLEMASTGRSHHAIRKLMKLFPETALVRRGTSEEEIVRIEDIRAGERLVIRPGERIPLDGSVTGGDSFVNQAPITGESIPVGKKSGDPVFAGTLNGSGVLEIEVTRQYGDSTLARIVRLVEESQMERAPVQQLADRFSNYYTPCVLVVAFLVAIVAPLLFHEPFGVWFYRSLVVLVISCPCALVISTPVTIVSGLTNAARNGILIRGGRHLEALGTIRVVAFDKTGTLTEGTPRVTEVIPLDSLTPPELLAIAATVEAHSEHHLAGALLRKAHEEHLPLDDALLNNFETLTGQGVTARINDTGYIVGSHSLIEQQGLCSREAEEVISRLEKNGNTVLLVATTGKLLGVIGVTDHIRGNARDAVAGLKNRGLDNIIMLTGDNPVVAGVIAGQAGIEKVHAEILPENKAGHVHLLREQFGEVMMVGDGINDAPAMAAATVGVAMGGTSADVAMETADVVLMSDDLQKLPYAVTLSRRVVAIIRQNIFLALAIKLAIIALGAVGIASLWLALIADDGVTLLVIINGMRALRNLPS